MLQEQKLHRPTVICTLHTGCFACTLTMSSSGVVLHICTCKIWLAVSYVNKLVVRVYTSQGVIRFM